MNTKHTPGPWEIRGPITCKDGVVIADVFAGNGRADVGSDEALEANKLLIAAAPDLAEALQALLDWGSEHTSPTDPNSPHALLVASCAALAKAGAL